MAKRKHPAAVDTEVHRPFRWTPANATARNAINIGASFGDDVGCFAWQQDDHSVWLAKATGTGSSKWQQVGTAFDIHALTELPEATGDMEVPVYDGVATKKVTVSAILALVSASGIAGPGSSTVNAVVLWNATDGSVVKDSLYTGHADASVSAAKDIVTKEYADALLLTFNVTKKNHGDSPYTLTTTDSTLHLDTAFAAGDITVNLWDPALKRGTLIKDSGFNAAVNHIILHRHGSEKIEGSAADKTLSVSGGEWLVYSDGTDYFISGPT